MFEGKFSKGSLRTGDYSLEGIFPTGYYSAWPGTWSIRMSLKPGGML